jgi:2-oxoglutarate dehydrogenase E2 component (dihydrolipoamide succinyltransferase)
MPKLGESVVEGVVAAWLKAPGDRVEKMEPLLAISTDKIDTEVPSPASGPLLAIYVPTGKTVPVGTLLAAIGEPDEESAPHSAGLIPSQPSAAGGQTPAGDAAPMRRVTVSERGPGRSFFSPVVKRIAREHGIDASQIAGSGLGGRVTKKDVLAFLAQEHSAGRAPGAAVVRSEAPPATSLSPDEVLEPLSSMRRAIAQHMVHSKETSPHAVTVFEVDMTAVVRHREEYKAALAERGVKLTFTPYFVAAAARALRAAPLVNSRFSEQGIVLNRRIHIGVAVALANGLVAPVIRDADEKNLAGLARAVNDLAERARSGKLTPDEVSGGTFTVTNHGVGGSLTGAAIINQPQAAILGIGAIVKRPVVRSNSPSLLPSADDAIVIRPMCYLSLSFDHRNLDGADADQFLTAIKETLENWRDAPA